MKMIHSLLSRMPLPVKLGIPLASVLAAAAGLLLSASIGLFGYTESLAVPDARTSLAVEFTSAAVLAAAAAIVLAAPLRRRRS